MKGRIACLITCSPCSQRPSEPLQIDPKSWIRTIPFDQQSVVARLALGNTPPCTRSYLEISALLGVYFVQKVNASFEYQEAGLYGAAGCDKLSQQLFITP